MGLCSLSFDLRPNFGGGNEDKGDFLQKIPCMYCYTQCPQPGSRPPPTRPLPETPGHSQASLDQSLVGSLLLSPGPLCTSFCLCPPRVYFPALCKFWQLYGGGGGLMATSSKRAYAIPRSAAPRAPAPAASHY